METYTQTLDKVVKVIKEKLNITVNIESVNKVKRLGESRLNNNYCRPILLCLNSGLFNYNILEKKSNLKGTNIYINTDRNKDTQKSLYQCRHIMKLLRENGISTRIAYDSMKINNKFYKLEKVSKMSPEEVLSQCKEIDNTKVSDLKKQTTNTPNSVKR